MLPPSLRAFAFVFVFPFGSLSFAQEPPAPADPIGTALQADLDEADAVYESQRADLQQRLEQAYELASEVDRERLELELESFQLSGVLPASIPDKARELAFARRQRLQARRGVLAAAVKQYQRRGLDEAATENQALLDEVDQQLELASWHDLRCLTLFAKAAATSGFAWQGAALMSPPDRPGILRLPSDMDGEGLIAAYQVRLEVERVSGEGPLRLFFALPNRPAPDRELAALVLDESGRTQFDAVRKQGSGPTHDGALLVEGVPSVVLMTCEHDGIRVEVDGKEVLAHDQLNDLQMPSGWRKRLADNNRSFHVVTPADTRFRILGASFRAMPQRPLTAPAAATASGDLPEDQMPLGKVWRGKRDDGLRVTARVVARNQRAKVATIDLRGSDGWHVIVPVRTDARGADFTIGDVRRRDAKVKIFDESGSGNAGLSGMEMKWRWNNLRNHPCKGKKKGVAEGSFRSQ